MISSKKILVPAISIKRIKDLKKLNRNHYILLDKKDGWAKLGTYTMKENFKNPYVRKPTPEELLQITKSDL